MRKVLLSEPSNESQASMSPGPIDPRTNVLVVEDEMVLRMRAVDIVEDAGFTAVEAVNADEALAILESRSDISLLFSDIQMPGSMDGVDLAHWIGRELPRVKVLLTSGKVGRGEVGEWPLLAKPYRLGELEGQLRDFLELS